MSEYIERRALLKKAVVISPEGNYGSDQRIVFAGEIESFPAADVEPIVRCGECVNRTMAEGSTEMRCVYLQACRVGNGSIVRPNDKCHLPKRVESSASERSESGE